MHWESQSSFQEEKSHKKHKHKKHKDKDSSTDGSSSKKKKKHKKKGSDDEETSKEKKKSSRSKEMDELEAFLGGGDAVSPATEAYETLWSMANIVSSKYCDQLEIRYAAMW